MHNRTMNAALSVFVLALLSQLPLAAQSGQKAEDGAKPLETGTFHGKVHSTSGRATVYQETDGKLLLRLTQFKTPMDLMSMSS